MKSFEKHVHQVQKQVISVVAECFVSIFLYDHEDIFWSKWWLIFLFINDNNMDTFSAAGDVAKTWKQLWSMTLYPKRQIKGNSGECRLHSHEEVSGSFAHWSEKGAAAAAAAVSNQFLHCWCHVWGERWSLSSGWQTQNTAAEISQESRPKTSFTRFNYSAVVNVVNSLS